MQAEHTASAQVFSANKALDGNSNQSLHFTGKMEPLYAGHSSGQNELHQNSALGNVSLDRICVMMHQKISLAMHAPLLYYSNRHFPALSLECVPDICSLLE